MGIIQNVASFAGINKHDITASVGINTHNIDLISKSQNAPVPYPTMHHFETEMCTHLHITDTKYGALWNMPEALWISEMGLLPLAGISNIASVAGINT